MKVLAAGNALVRTLGAGPDTSPAQAIVVEGGAGVTEYATIAELVTASEGSLSAGYYQVTADVPVTHPQYPRVLTYWDGATFEPEISTGFEDRPALADERIVLDTLEWAYRNNLADGAVLGEMLPQVGAKFTRQAGSSGGVHTGVVVRTATSPPYIQRGAGTTLGLHRYRSSTAGLPTGDTAFSVIVAGAFTSVRNDSGDNWQFGFGPVSNSGRGSFVFRSRNSSVLRFQYTFDFSTFVTITGGTPRAGGDVLIFSYDPVGDLMSVWLNGAKTTYSEAAINLPGAASTTLGNTLTASAAGTGYGLFSYFAGSGAQIDDAAAAAWTAWLQARYSIPVL